MDTSRMAAVAEALSFLAAELAAPLATVAGCIDVVASRHLGPRPHIPPGIVQFAEDYPGELMTALERAQRRAARCQSLLVALVQSTREAHAPRPRCVQGLSAHRLLSALLEGFPFGEAERNFVVTETLHDFHVPAQHELIYIVLCVLTRNAVEALRQAPEPCLRFEITQDEAADAGSIRICNNSPLRAPHPPMQVNEVAPSYLQGGTEDIGMMFCQRVMRSLGGSVETRSAQGMGTTVTLQFALNGSLP